MITIQQKLFRLLKIFSPAMQDQKLASPVVASLQGEEQPLNRNENSIEMRERNTVMGALQMEGNKNALCLLGRLSQLGPGARAAAQRWQAALHLEERRRQERQAFDLAWQAKRSS